MDKTEILNVIDNSGISIKDFSYAGASVLVSAVLSKVPLINVAHEAIKITEQKRLELLVEQNVILLGMLSKTDTSNYYTHLKIINDTVFDDIKLDVNIQHAVVNFANTVDVSKTLDNKAIKWLQSKQNFELNIIGSYKLFVAEKEQEVYISTIDEQDIMEELFESNIPLGTYNSGPRKYKKLNELGLHIMTNLFRNVKVNEELVEATEQVNRLKSLDMKNIMPKYESENSYFYNNGSPNGKYTPLSDLDNKYIAFYLNQNEIIRIEQIGNVIHPEEINQLWRHNYRSQELKKSNTGKLLGSKVNVSTFSRNENYTYYFEWNQIEKGYNNKTAKFSWENILST